MSARLQTLWTPPESGEPAQSFEVRDHQVEALARQWQAREEGQERSLGHLATGGGKTTVWVLDAMKYREECAQMETPLTPRYLYVSHKHEINRQAAERLKRFMPDAEITFFDPRKAQKRPEADFTFATIQSLYSQLHTFDPEDFENIFWDEAHHLEARTFKKVLQYFRPLFENAATATVARTDSKDIREYFGEAVFSKGLPDGIAEGWLAGVDYRIVFDKAIKEEVAAGFNPKTLKEIDELFKKKAPPEVLADSIREEIAGLGLEEPKTLVFCESVEEADEMARLLDGVAYHTYTDDRPKVLKGLKSGTIKTVTAKDMFNEGVDIPDIEVVVFLRATKSGSLYEQQLGRGLRKIPGKNKVCVLDFVANIERISKVRELSEAIKSRAKQLGKQSSDAPRQGGEGKLHVHTEHGDFDFDRVAVDLLEKWSRLRSGGRLVDKSNEELVKLALSLTSGKIPRTTDIERLSKARVFVSNPTIIKRFGSFPNFQKACGFEVNWDTLSDDEIVARALELKADGPMKWADLTKHGQQGRLPSYFSIKQRFGPIGNFQRACGFEVVNKGEAAKSMSADGLIALARELSPDSPLTCSMISKLSKERRFPSTITIEKHFGSITAFQKACGFEVKEKPVRQVDNRASDEELIKIARTLKPDGPITTKELDVLSKAGKFVSITIIRKRFGTMHAFQKACGFEAKSDK